MDPRWQRREAIIPACNARQKSPNNGIAIGALICVNGVVIGPSLCPWVAGNDEWRAFKRPYATLLGVRANFYNRAVYGVKNDHRCEGNVYRERNGGEQDQIAD